MLNNRQSYRLHKQFDINWSVPPQNIKGQGIIFNISRTGMLFVTDKLFEPQHGLIMSFHLDQVPAFPSKGKLVWFRKAGQDKSHYQCGIRFLFEDVHQQAWITWMEESISKLADVTDNKILGHILSEGQEE